MLSKIEVEEYAEFLAQLYPVTANISIRLYKELNITQLRKDFSTYLRCKSKVPWSFTAEEVQHLNLLKDYESIFAVQFDAAIRSVIKRKYPTLLANVRDVEQECRMVIVHALWTYDGRSALITFIFRCIQNLLKGLLNHQDIINRPSKKISSQLAQVTKIMRETNASYEDAVMQVGNKNLLKYKNVALHARSFSFDTIADEENKPFDIAFIPDKTHSPYLEENLDKMREAILYAPLSELQKSALETVLEGNHLSDLADELGFTRQHISKQYTDALVILRHQMGIAIAA